ncbi:MAG: T9SS type A sorting domain-containing protein [Tannerella sp.]|nr:T9SS type A sorting domain-containing protein [Tannerella sp.]
MEGNILSYADRPTVVHTHLYTSDGRLIPPQLIQNPANDDEYFFNFRLTNFAPDTEPFIKETFGDELILEYDEGFWVYHSYTSCAVSFSTNLPTISVIEYGVTSDYGQTTARSDSYYYRHLHYLKGLQPNTIYHYRIKVQDYDGSLIISGDHTFTTKELTDDIIRIPEDFEGLPLPYTLTKSNAKYVLTQDITVPTAAINIKAHNVELDLDGHTVIYDNETPAVIGGAWNDYAYNEEASFGIRAGLWNYTNIKVFNGIIKQGANGGMGYIGIGFNPLFLNHMGAGSYNEIAGVTVDYYGASVTGMVCGNGYVHHNVIIDRGTVVDNRHQGIKAMTIGSNVNNEVAYNSLRRFRHQGIMGSGYKHHNEVYSDSFDSNSFLIASGAEGRIENNKMFGMGYNPVGTNWDSNTVISGNFIYLHGTAPSMRSAEYARLSGIAGLRYTLYGDTETSYENSLYEDNTIILKAWEGCNLARGIWTATGERNKGVIYRRNTVKVEAVSDKVNFTDVNAAISCVDVNGGSLPLTDPLPSTPMIFEDNTLIGNVNLITFGSSYGIGGSTRFYRTRLERINHTDTYFFPIRLGYWHWNTRDNYIIDAIPGEGVDLEQAPKFHGSTGYMEVYYGQTKKILIAERCDGNPLRNTDVTISADGLSPIVVKTDNDGYLDFEILTVRHLKAESVISRTDYVSYTFTVSGYPFCTIATDVLKEREGIALNDVSCDPVVSTEQITEKSITLAPNPAKSYFYINGLKGDETIQLIDLSGRLLYTQKANEDKEQISVTRFSPGTYLVRIIREHTVRTLKVIID